MLARCQAPCPNGAMHTSATAIFWPMLTLMAWTALMLLQVPIRRFRAYFAGRVAYHDFDCGESAAVPHDVAVPNRVFMNLLEVPVMFYLLCLMCFITGLVTPLVCTLAWVYVALRVAHSLIYLTYNRVFHRFLVFASSNMLVLALIVIVGMGLWQGRPV